MRQVEINTDGEVVAWANCDGCGDEHHPDAMHLIQRPGAGDTYRCTDCTAKRDAGVKPKAVRECAYCPAAAAPDSHFCVRCAVEQYL